MQTRMIKDLQVPVVGMGSAGSFDVPMTELETRKQILNNCITQGSNFVDTSPMYRRSEQVIGAAMEGKRDKFQLATKVWCTGRDTAVKQMARSFELLRTDYIEVMQIHNLVDWRTHLPLLEEMKADGKIGVIGPHPLLPRRACLKWPKSCERAASTPSRFPTTSWSVRSRT